MRLPQFHMSNGAWIFASAVAMAVIAPAVYAAANSIVAIGNQSGTTTAFVTPTRQLQTVTTAPTNIVQRFSGANAGQCAPVYTPPSGKAIVVTQITYKLGTGTQGAESYGLLTDAGCNNVYDLADTIDAHETQSHSFPTGRPMPSIALDNYVGSGAIQITVTGYLIPASQLP